MNNKITFPRLATLLADKSGRSKRFSEDFLREFFTLISENLEAGESVKVKGLGTFRLSAVEPRKSVDVTTGLPMEISGHTKVSFTPAKELAETVNSPFEAFSAIEINEGTDISSLMQDEDVVEEDTKDDSQPDSEEAVALSNEPTFDEATDITFMVEAPMNLDYDYKEIIERKTKQLDAISTPYRELHHTDIQEDLHTGNSLEENPHRLHSHKTEEISYNNEDDEPMSQTENLDSIKDELLHQDRISEENDGQLQETSSEDESDFSEYEPSSSEKRERLKKNIIKIFLTILGAAVLGLIITFAVWYFVATSEFKKSQKVELATVTNINQLHSQKETPEVIAIEDTDSIADDSLLASNGEEKEIEESVPTAPSDPIVYDTIGTSRYLTTMAKDHYGNYNLWPYIYEENKTKLGHPDRIRPGTPVVIPKLSKYGVDPYNNADIEKAKKIGIEIYAKYGKKI